MFKLVLTEKEIIRTRVFCSDGYFGARINTALAAYATDDRFVRTWYEEKDGRILAVMQLTEGAATIKCTAQCDFGSLTALLHFAGAKTVIGDIESMKNFPFSATEQGVLMHSSSPQKTEIAAELLDSEQLNLLYPVLFGEETAQADRRAYAAWFADLSHRVRHGLCDCFAVFDGKKAVSCAAVLYSNAKYGCIGAVATNPDFRGKGYGRICTLTAAHSVMQSGQMPCLACDGSGIQKWYESMGFTVFGEWAQCII